MLARRSGVAQARGDPCQRRVTVRDLRNRLQRQRRRERFPRALRGLRDLTLDEQDLRLQAQKN